MAITIDESTQVITVEQSDLTFVTGTLYELNTNVYRLAVGALLASERYMWMEPAFNHNGEVTVAGTTFARIIEQTNGYILEFEDLTYTVRLAGSNNNLFDVENGILAQNAVQVISTNSAGLVRVDTGAADTAAIIGAVEDWGVINYSK